ncbi:MAG TPA: carbamoyltransferase HypF [Thermoleophilaceae bacterium]
MTTAVRARARVEGVVQGVGFRPYVYRLARELGLAGWVLNDDRGVLLEVEGAADAVDELLRRLPHEAPPLASVEHVGIDALPASGETGFRIAESSRRGEADALVSADSTTCEDCLRELFDPADRRFRYPFVNCTNCGPRFTIVRGVPYDRRLTTMAGFRMCPACQAEYDDPADRRFHAQPNACPDCGPSLRLADRDGRPAGGDPLSAAVAALAEGRILAVKGLGGYHLACDARDERAVAALRSRKRREDKPFALMTVDAHELVELRPEDEELLRSRERPIVIARRRPGSGIAPSVAPLSPDLGVMLPYSPLHHLLLADFGGPLVMTSGNVSDEPIAYEDEDALTRLREIADLFLSHDRPIHMRTDDSVVRSTGRGPMLMRRSRGHVPSSLPLPVEAGRRLLACGAELKSTFCLAKGGRAWVGHHIGDLKNWETLRSFRSGIEHFERVFAVSPEVVAHDLHPHYLSTSYAQEIEGAELVGVQHHHAHLAACLAEHGETGPAVGAIFDGSGYGPDGTVWGGELLVGDLRGYERVGLLHPVRLPGGDRAAREPWRMACAWLDDEADPLPGVSPQRWDEVAELVRTGLASPLTTSMGRLFDAVSALCGIRLVASYEGQPAVELEALADRSERGAYPLPLLGERPVALDARETVHAVRADLAAGVPAAVVSARFHNGVAGATAAACERQGTATVVLSGGVFQNRLLLERTAEQLERAGLRVLVPRRLPPNDGGISYGQAAVAAALA